jgi:hypothetical protein
MMAAPGLLDSLRDPVGAFLHMLTGALAHFIDGARADIERTLQRHLFSTVDTSVPGARPITENPSLRRLNLGMALATDILVGAVIVFASLRSMWERSLRARYSLKVMLPRLLLALVLVHFSLPLMQMGIDLDNALCRVALSLGNELHVDGLPWSPVVSQAAAQKISLTQDLFHGVLGVIVVVTLVILVLAYVLRHALLCVLIVLAPLAGLMTTLPDTRNYSRTWLRLFMVTVFMQAVQLFVLRVAGVVGLDEGGGLVQTLDALATLYLMLKVPGALNEAAHLETKAETMGKHLEKAVRKAAIHAIMPPHTTRRRSA